MASKVHLFLLKGRGGEGLHQSLRNLGGEVRLNAIPSFRESNYWKLHEKSSQAYTLFW